MVAVNLAVSQYTVCQKVSRPSPRDERFSPFGHRRWLDLLSSLTTSAKSYICCSYFSFTILLFSNPVDVTYVFMCIKALLLVDEHLAFLQM